MTSADFRTEHRTVIVYERISSEQYYTDTIPMMDLPHAEAYLASRLSSLTTDSGYRIVDAYIETRQVSGWRKM